MVDMTAGPVVALNNTNAARLNSLVPSMVELQSIRFSSAEAAVKCVAFHLGTDKHVAYEPSVAYGNAWGFETILPLCGSRMQVLSDGSPPSYKTNLLVVSAENAGNYLQLISTDDAFGDITIAVASQNAIEQPERLILDGAKIVISGEYVSALDAALINRIYSSARHGGYSIGLQFGPDSIPFQDSERSRAQVLLEQLVDNGLVNGSDFEVVYDSLHCFNAAKLAMVAEVGRERGFNIR